MNVQIDTPVTHISPVGTISGAGIRAINALMAVTDVRTDSEWQAANAGRNLRYLPELPDTWAYVWMVERGAYRGTFAKRVRQWLYAEHGVIAPEPWLAAIGQLARAHSAARLSYSFTITRSLYWRAGEYGDYGSCIMHSNSHALQAMTDAGVLAMRFHRENGAGFARAWVMPYAGGFVVWNAYGLQLVEVARVLAEHTGLQYAECRVSNNDETSGVVWINGGRGCLVHAEPEAYSDIDLGIYDCFTCQFCGRGVDPDDSYNVNDDWACWQCYRHIVRCDDCGRWVIEDDLVQVDRGLGPVLLCEDCR